MLENKVALITGASRSIGRQIAISMAKAGANIAIVFANNDEAANSTLLEVLAEGVQAKCYKCDVSDFSETESVIKQVCADFGRIDILVNNAGITKDKLVLQMSEEEYDKVLDTNLKGAFNMIRHTYRQFLRNRYGRIINITSVSGLMGNAGQANYSASKAGLVGLTKTIAKELAAKGVTCNAIAPGYIGTDMTSAMNEEAKEAIANAIPLKRIGKPEDVANLAVFLASDLSEYITGEVIKVDGGLYI